MMPDILELDAQKALTDRLCDIATAILITQQKLSSNIVAQSAFSAQVIADVVQFRRLDCHTTNTRDALDFLQLWTATGSLGQCISTGQLARASDWAIAAFNDDLAFGNDIADGGADIDRIRRMLISNNKFVQLNAELLVCQWTELFFYYCRRMQAFPDLARQLFAYCFEVVRLNLSTLYPESLDALLRMSEWAGVFDDEKAQALAPVLQSMYGDGYGPVAWKLAVLLTTKIGQYTSKSCSAWSVIVYNKHWKEVDDASRLRILVQLASDHEMYDSYREQLLCTIDRIQGDLARASPFEQEQWREATFISLYPVVNALVRAKNVSSLMELLGHWFSIRVEEMIEYPLFVLPFMEQETIWLTNAICQAIPHETLILEDVIQATNRALRIVITHDGKSGLQGPHEARLLGLPDFHCASAFEDNLLILFGFKHLMKAGWSQRESIVPFFGSPIPFQALSMRSGIECRPITASLCRVLPERQLRRIGLWIDPILHGDTECEFVRSQSVAAGIDLVIEISGGTDERRRFSEFYERPDLDVLWIIGHGERAAYAPDESCLNISHDGSLSVGDLVSLAVPDNGKRRLLILNVCSAGGAVSYGGMSRAGLAAMLTRASQSTISHLWPVPAAAAACFGSFLAHALTAGNSFFAAYMVALRAMNVSTKTVVEQLRSFANGEALATIAETAGYDFSNILVSGSAIYLE